MGTERSGKYRKGDDRLPFEEIPAELKALPQWVCYMLIDDSGKDKPRKIPINPHTLRGASAGKPDTWGTFEKAVEQIGKMGTVIQQGEKPISAPIVGIGFEFVKGGGYVGIDFDHCIENGALNEWANNRVEWFNSYTELSPSGTGLHIICKGKLPGRAVKRPHAEMYDENRYFTFTGDSWGFVRPVAAADHAITRLYEELQADRKKTVEQSTGGECEAVSSTPAGNALGGMEAARHSKNAAKFDALYMGQWQGSYESQSQADQAFCNMLAFYCRKDAAAMDEVFRRSGLMRPKWDENHGGRTYGAMTIEKAIADTKEIYEPKAEWKTPVDVWGRTEYTQQTAEKKLEAISATELQKMQLPPVQFIINGLLPVGLGLLVSPPKYGKSWMVLDMGLSVTSGSLFLGRSTNPGGCLYLALEDSLNRLKDRMEKVLKGAVAPAGFDYAVKCLDLSHGLLEQLNTYLQEKPNTRLIIIDTLQKIRGSAGRENAYNADYREMGLLKAFADQHAICILLVHHLRKMADDGDPFNRISGTAAIFGAADVAMVLSREKRGDTQTKLSYQGRDIEGGDQILEFDKEAFRWKLLGDESWIAEEKAKASYQNSPVVQTIKKLLEQHPEGWSGTSSELLDAGKVLLTAYIAANPRDLTNKLAPLDKPLFDYDRIVHTRAKNGTGGGKHRFYFASTDKYEQTVFSPI